MDLDRQELEKIYEQGYGFYWKGKGQAVKDAENDEEGFIDFYDGNLYIEGDNLIALKRLQKEYKGKIKMIYIDPPYNTKKKFIYNDIFLKKKKESLSKGDRLHSNWLNMMYPRLELARDLLSDDGVIFISIDDNEQANLKLMCDEIFGEENFIKDLIVNTSEGGGNAKYVVNGHEVVFVYVKNVMKFDNLKRPKDIRGKKVYINGELYWIQEDAIREQFGKYGNLHYEDLTDIKGENFKKKIDLGIKNNEYILVPKAYGKTIIGKLRKVSEDFSKFHSILNVGRINKHLTADGIRELEELFEVSKGNSPFENPKPLELIKRLILATTFKGNNNDIILDFFSGSATTAHAVMQLNAEDGGNRKYIMVQLPELCDEKSEAYKAGYKNICEIGKERIRRAGEKIKSDETLPAENREKLDIGFKVIKI